MHKYVVQLDIIPVDSPAKKTTVALYDTTFTAVTSYQNTDVSSACCPPIIINIIIIILLAHSNTDR